MRAPRHVFTLGLDVDLNNVVTAIQCERGAIALPQKFSRARLVQWVKEKVAAGHTVHTVYEACGFGYTLHEHLGDRSERAADLAQRTTPRRPSEPDFFAIAAAASAGYRENSLSSATAGMGRRGANGTAKNSPRPKRRDSAAIFRQPLFAPAGIREGKGTQARTS